MAPRSGAGGLALPALERLVAIVDEQAKGPPTAA